MMLIQPLSFLILYLFSALSFSAQPWSSWMNDLRKEALSSGISPETFDEAFKNVHEPNHKIKHLAHSQPEHRLSYYKYRNSRVDAYRIAIGKRKLKEYHDTLTTIAQDFQVDPCFVLAFWGLETSYGSYMGDFPVIQSLATLAYDSNRPDFFKRQLMIALHILNDGHVSLSHFKGEWAGASGHPQFLPSSWVEYAVDYDHDGRKDIWDSKPDALASIANYMKKNGWKNHEPWAVFVSLPPGFDRSLMGKNTLKSVSDWNKLGIRTLHHEALPYPSLMASIIQPEGGPVFLAYPNYKMILKYNNSIYYAGAIGYLADSICQRPTEQ